MTAAEPGVWRSQSSASTGQAGNYTGPNRVNRYGKQICQTDFPRLTQPVKVSLISCLKMRT